MSANVLIFSDFDATDKKSRLQLKTGFYLYLLPTATANNKL